MQKHNICHRDLKLQNILIKKSQLTFQTEFNYKVKISDFGCSKIISFHQLNDNPT